MEKHPQLKRKLQFLYHLQLNPNIETNSDLAHSLGISKQSVSRWCTGSETARGDAIPVRQLSKVSELFSVKPEWFSLSLKSFEKKVRKSLQSKTKLSHEVKISISTLPSTRLNVVGRRRELQSLDLYLKDGRSNIIEIVAFGGTGKSALINKWLSELSKTNYQNASRIYAWSFYNENPISGDSSAGDCFLEHALQWFGDLDPSKGTSWSKANRLAELVRQERTILILDGLEPLQHGPGQCYGSIKNKSLAYLVKELASKNNGLCIITSRFPVKELASFFDARAIRIDLERLTNSAGIQLLIELGIQSDRNLFEEAVETYSGHALSLTLLAGYTNTVFDGQLDLALGEEVPLIKSQVNGRIEQLMANYFKWLDCKDALQILRIVSLLGRNTSLNEIVRIVSLCEITGFTDKLRNYSRNKWKLTLNELCEAGLIEVSKNTLDVAIENHPLIREWIKNQFREDEAEAYRNGHKLLFEYLKSDTKDLPSSAIEYEPLYRSVMHGVASGSALEAFQFYYSKVKNRYPISLASHSLDQSCVKCFFKKGWDELSYPLPEEAKYFLISSAATNLMALGELEESIELSYKCIGYFSSVENSLNVTLIAGPLVSMLIEAGRLKQAMELLHDLEPMIESSNNPVIVAMANNFKAYANFLNGNYKTASKQFALAESVLQLESPGFEVGFPTVSSYFCKYLLEIDELNFALNRSLKTFAWRERKSWQVSVDTASILASDVLVQAEIFHALGDVVNAKLYFDKQIDLFRSADEWLYLPTGLNSRARFNTALGNYDLAFEDLMESLGLAKSTGAKFGEWEAHIDMAKLFVSINDFERAEESFRNAQEIDGMDQYKFRNREIKELEQKLSLR